MICGLTITDAYDGFPSWDPIDGDTGNWNSGYDAVSLTGASHVWVDHNEYLDSEQPSYFGRPYQVHDGLLDITNGSDLVTVSYNKFHSHDKTMLMAKHNALTLSPEIPLSSVIGYDKGTVMTENDDRVNGRRVDLLARYNAAHDPDIAEVPAFTPPPRRTVHPSRVVPRVVSALAGPRHLSRH